ncbi:hypothetical protein GCK32_015712, partial [Trichostrongylus colubriformis]
MHLLLVVVIMMQALLAKEVPKICHYEGKDYKPGEKFLYKYFEMECQQRPNGISVVITACLTKFYQR